MAVTKSCTALDSITSTAWDLARNTEDDRIRLQALTLIKETEKDKIDIVSNVNIVDQIVSEQEKQQQQQYVVPAPTPTEEEENALAAEYIRDEKYRDSEEPTSVTKEEDNN
jgi:hypothetical protein